MMMKSLLIILLLGTTGVDSFFSFLSNIMDVVNLVTDISDIVTGQHDVFNGNLFKKKTNPTLDAVNKMSEQIEELSKVINIKLDKLLTVVLKDVPRSIQYANLMRKLIGYIGRIDELFEDYQFYVRKFGNMSQYTMEDFSNVATSHKYGDVPDILRQMYHLFIPGQLDQRDESLLDSVTATLNAASAGERCNQLKTSQQQLFGLYETVIVTEIKGYTMETYAYGLLAIYHNRSLDIEIQQATARTVFRCTQYMMVIKQYLNKVSQQVWMCDPPRHIEDKNYVKFMTLKKEVNARSSSSIVAFSLRRQLADVEYNKVVTAVRFVEKDRLIHVQIEQGKLLANGKIDERYVRWKDLEDFDYRDDPGEETFELMDRYGDYNELEEGVDFQLIHGDQRGINLDNIFIKEPDYVVVGMKLSRDPDNAKAIQLEVVFMKVDIASGTLDRSKYVWYTFQSFQSLRYYFTPKSKLVKKRINFSVKNKKTSTKSYDNIPDSEDFSLVEFDEGDSGNDPYKVFVPFIDIQPVMSSPRLPLSGVGIFHRGEENSGGFLGLKVKTFNIGDFLNTNVTEEVTELFKNNMDVVNTINNPNVHEK